jgi:carboxyl-terminal processing protease
VGSVAELVVVSPGLAPRAVSVRRQRVEVPSVDGVRMLDPSLGIGYLQLTCFQKTTCRDLDSALRNLHKMGMRSLIMDLRGNPGGLLVTAVEVADRFLEAGVIVSTRGRSVQEDFTYSAHQDGTWRVPLVVLIDHDSASAAEIFAGAIGYHHRGTVVGTRSYGKGSVQSIVHLDSANGGLRLTTSKFYSPDGQPYGRIGVEPDIVVQQVARPIDGSGQPPATSEDPVLDAAVQAAQQLLAQRWSPSRGGTGN